MRTTINMIKTLESQFRFVTRRAQMRSCFTVKWVTESLGFCYCDLRTDGPHPSLTTDYEKGLAFQSGLLWLKDMRVLCELCGRLFLPLDPQSGSLVDPSSALSCSTCPGVSREGRSPRHRGWFVLLSGQTIWGMRFQAQAGDKSS